MATCNVCGVKMEGGCAATNCPHVTRSGVAAPDSSSSASRGARSWERWAVVSDLIPAYVYVGLAANRASMERRADPGERVIRVRITEIPEAAHE